MSKYSLGIDFGTLSARALLVDVADGREIASAVFEYPHGVMDEKLPSGKKLGVDWALQHPQDYLDALYNTIPGVLRESGINAEDVIGVGTDFTSCTMLPVKADGTPLCFLDEYKDEPNAYVKLWKHHAAQDMANRLNEIAEQRGEKWLNNYGGKVSSEWSIPKLMQVLKEAPEIYEAMDAWVEAADWILWQMTGVRTFSSCTAGYKALYNSGTGFPSNDFFAALDPQLENVVKEKLGDKITPLGGRVGGITAQMAAKTGLKEGTPVAVGIIDAHVCMPGAGIDGPNKMMAIMGTSACFMMMSQDEVQLPGISGVVRDGIMPGYYGYEAGQSCMGDHYAWFAENCCPAAYAEAAKKEGLSIHGYLTRLAAKLKPGESGLLALDWWNGNRSVLSDADLTGMMLGMTLSTRAEEMYRALIEATAFGARVIVYNFIENGVPVNEFYASGGISRKNAMAMQIYADVLKMPVKIADSDQGGALGGAIFGTVAAGAKGGGYDDVFAAARAMGGGIERTFEPNPESSAIYDELFAEYLKLHDYFGRGTNKVMKVLKRIKKSGTV